MKRYIAQYARGGFPDLYAVLDTVDHCVIGECKPYHEANDEADERNRGVFGQTKPEADLFSGFSGFSGWMAILPDAP